MSRQDNGGPAFPSHGSMGEVAHEGMSLRDYFAAQVMAECMTIPLRDKPTEERALWIAVTAAYRIADAMLKVRAE